jgi:hypothetical protein
LKYESVTKLGKENIDNPVVAFFGTERLYGRARNTLGIFIGRRVFKYGYANWSEMQYATYQYTFG